MPRPRPATTCRRRRTRSRRRGARAAGRGDPGRRAARARSPGALTAVGARRRHRRALAWVPRRAGERGALEAGALPNLLPGGRPVADARPAPRWPGPGASPALPDGRAAATPTGIAGRGARHGRGRRPRRSAGVDPDDLAGAARRAGWPWPTPASWSAWSSAPARSPSAPTWCCRSPPRAEKSGTFVDWEGGCAVRAGAARTGGMRDCRVLAALADEMDVRPRLPGRPPRRCAELARLGAWPAPDPPPPASPADGRAHRGPGRPCWPPGTSCSTAAGCRTASRTWPAPPGRPCAGLAATAAESGVADGDQVTVATERGSISLPVRITDMPDRVVWLPTNSPASVTRDLQCRGRCTSRSGRPAVSEREWRAPCVQCPARLHAGEATMSGDGSLGPCSGRSDPCRLRQGSDVDQHDQGRRASSSSCCC